MASGRAFPGDLCKDGKFSPEPSSRLLVGGVLKEVVMAMSTSVRWRREEFHW